MPAVLLVRWYNKDKHIFAEKPRFLRIRNNRGFSQSNYFLQPSILCLEEGRSIIKKTLTIVVVCDVLGQENNGTTIAAMHLIRALRNKGHHVRVVCSDIFRVGEQDYYIVPQLNLGPINKYVKKNGVVPATPAKRILDAAMDGADLVHIMMPLALGSAAAAMAKRKRIPITAGFHCQAENVTSHIVMKDFLPANRIAYRIFYRNLYRHCVCIHYPSQFICDTFEAIVGPTPHRIISNGVDPIFTPDVSEKPPEFQDKFVILFTGRYSPEKCHRVLIDATALSAYKDRIQLIFAGSGPLEDALKRRAKRRGISVPVMNFFSRKDQIEAIACLEAIACGKVPLIADSPRSATRYFALSNRNLFHYNDPADLARKMDWWLEHPKERASCASSYLGYAVHFDFQSCMDQMEQMMIEAAEVQNEQT